MKHSETVKLLEAAKDLCSCISGSFAHGPLPDGSYDQQQCQYCYDVDEAITALKEENQ